MQISQIYNPQFYVTPFFFFLANQDLKQSLKY